MQFGFVPYKRIISSVVLVFIMAQVIAQNTQADAIFKSFSVSYSKGDFLNAEKFLQKLIDSKSELSKDYLVAVLNNFGVVCIKLGRYNDALLYFNQAENLVRKDPLLVTNLPDIFINKSRVYGLIKEPDKAIEYLEQSVKFYTSNYSFRNTDDLNKLAKAYLNLGLTYLEKNELYPALLYLQKSNDIKVKNNLPDKGLIYLNLAKVFSKLNQPIRARSYFLKSIDCFVKEQGEYYYRLADVYFDYGLFLRKIGNYNESYSVHLNALKICVKNYGPKHTFVSLAYKHIADYYFELKDFKTALEFYQRSLVAVVVNFNSLRVEDNPTLDSVLFDVRLLENLKSKAKALEALALQQETKKERIYYSQKGLETAELALQLIARIRSGYITPESKFYLAENEKATYIHAVRLAQRLYEFTNDAFYKNKMYYIACLSKAAILRNEIAENNALENSNDTLKSSYKKLLIDIASYGKLIEDELMKSNSDNVKVEFWKNALFDLNHKKEKIYQTIKELYPSYFPQKAEPFGLDTIQGLLRKDETIVEYLFADAAQSDPQKSLLIFTISKRKLSYKEVVLDSTFFNQMKIVREGTVFNSNVASSKYADALYSMYEKLIKPVEQEIIGEKLFIIPDESIAFLPFDAFITKKNSTYSISFDELHYLIYRYTISYGYTSSLLRGYNLKKVKNPKLIAFTPDYLKSNRHALMGAKNEVEEISKLFDTEKYDGVSESVFKNKVDKEAILHLAMHSQIDSNDSKYSFLVFDTIDDKENDCRLFNYEISSVRIKSLMVVLSACNTGNGNLASGEGVMSLARGFFLAGVPSVICTFWDVNDDASAKIMKNFYLHLSEGDMKSVALHKAKLDFILGTPPSYSHPSYWSSYEMIGDDTSIESSPIYTYIVWGVFLIVVLGAIYYFKISKIL